MSLFDVILDVGYVNIVRMAQQYEKSVKEENNAELRRLLFDRYQKSLKV